MANSGGKAKVVTGAAALALLIAPAVLAAQPQSVPDFSIPTSRPTNNPRAQGPVDSDAPIIRVPAARPSPTPSPVPVASPTTAPSAPAGTAPPPRQSAPARSTAPAPSTVAGPVPSPGTAPSPSRTAPGITPFPLPSSTIPVPAPTISTIEPPAAEASSASFWPWVAGGAGLLALLFAGLWWRSRRSAEVPQFEFIPPVVKAPAAAPVAAPTAPVTLPEPKLGTAPVAPPQTGLGIALEARRMSASLMATTLSYTLTLTNNSPDTLSALAIEGDMIAAHASLPPEQQMASSNERLELRHALVTLAPGESAEFMGDFRLPLASLNPIRAGDAAFFVPLARLRVEASTPAGEALVKVQTYVVGETGDTPGAGLRPFRLDLGPRTYSKVGQRAVN